MAMRLNFGLFLLSLFFLKKKKKKFNEEEKKDEKGGPPLFKSEKAYGNSGRLPCHHVFLRPSFPSTHHDPKS